MELRHLEIFCTVLEEGSFSKAAGTLHLTQPTVSIHIKALEETLSVKLIDRMGRKIQPTEAGSLLYKYARNIVTLKQDAISAINDHTGNIKGTFTMAASTIPGEYILPQILSDFRGEFTSVVPIVRIGDSKQVFDLVSNGRADIGVIGEAVKDRMITSESFMEDEIVLVAPKNFKVSSISQKDLEILPFIIRSAGSGSRSTVEKTLTDSGFLLDRLNICAELGSTQAMVEALKSSMGLAFISKRAVKELLISGEVREVAIKGFPIKRTLYTITNNMRTNSPITKTFLAFLKNYK